MKRLSSLRDASRQPRIATRTLLVLLGATFIAIAVACGSDPAADERAARSPSATATTPPTTPISATVTAQPATPTPTPTPAVTATPEPTPEATPEPTSEPTPPPPALSADFVALQASMQLAVDQYWVPGDYAVAVTDLQTGETVSVNGQRQQLAGCIPNLFVLFQVARDIEAGKYPAEQVEWLVSTTTWQSDATAAWRLYGVVGDGDVVSGVQRVNSLVHDVLQLEEVILDHPPGFQDSIGIDPNNWVTAEVSNRALAALWHGEVVGPEGRAYLLDHLATVKPGLNYLTAAVPEGVVSHKNGFLEADTGFVDNDAGIIRLTRGGIEYAYAMTFLSQEVQTKYADIPLGQQLGSLAYQTLAARYP